MDAGLNITAIASAISVMANRPSHYAHSREWTALTEPEQDFIDAINLLIEAQIRQFRNEMRDAYGG